MKLIKIIYILLLLIHNIWAVNYQVIKTGDLSFEYDKITAGFGFHWQEHPIISSSYPPTSLAIIQIDQKNYVLSYDADIIKEKIQENQITTQFELNKIHINQICYQDNDTFKLNYKIKNNNNINKEIRLILLFDIVPEIKQAEIYGYEKEFILSGPDILLKIKPDNTDLQNILTGDYDDLRDYKWPKQKKAKADAVVAISSEKTLSCKDEIEFGLSIHAKQIEKKETPAKPIQTSPEKKTNMIKKETLSPVDINEDDLDFFDKTEKAKQKKKSTPEIQEKKEKQPKKLEEKAKSPKKKESDKDLDKKDKSQKKKKSEKGKSKEKPKKPQEDDFFDDIF